LAACDTNDVLTSRVTFFAGIEMKSVYEGFDAIKEYAVRVMPLQPGCRCNAD